VRRKLALITEIISPYRIPVFNALARHENIDLQVIFLAETDPTQRQWLVYKEQIQFSYRVLPSWRRRVKGRNLLLNWGLRRALRQFSPDTIVCGGYNYLASWVALAWARRHAVPFLLWSESTAKDTRPGHSLIEWLKSRFVNGCRGFVVAGRSSFEYVQSFGIRRDAIFTAPNAVDNDFFSTQAQAARRDAPALRRKLNLPERYFVFVGRLIREKGVLELLQAYAALPAATRERFGLVFVGDGPVRAELEARADAIQLGTIKFTGFAHREQLAIYYGLAEALVFPTYTDPWGLVVNEAMACALPIVCSRDAGCVADLVEDHWNGRLVMQKDSKQLSAVLAELAANSEVRVSMGSHSRERIRQFSPEACAAGMAGAVLACAGSNG